MMPGGGSGDGLMELRGDTPTGTTGRIGASWYCLAGLGNGVKVLVKNGIPLIPPVSSLVIKEDIFVSINCKKVIIPTIDTFCKKLKSSNLLLTSLSLLVFACLCLSLV